MSYFYDQVLLNTGRTVLFFQQDGYGGSDAKGAGFRMRERA